MPFFFPKHEKGLYMWNQNMKNQFQTSNSYLECYSKSCIIHFFSGKFVTNILKFFCESLSTKYFNCRHFLPFHLAVPFEWLRKKQFQVVYSAQKLCHSLQYNTNFDIETLLYVPVSTSPRIDCSSIIIRSEIVWPNIFSLLPRFPKIRVLGTGT